MDNLSRFMSYATDFEKTLKDDDWSRLDGYFHDDAVYEVEGTSFACKLQGAKAIFAGIRKSLDGFDRKFESRDVEVTDGPNVDGDWLRMGWALTYHRNGWTDYTLRGASRFLYRDGKIAYMADTYDPSADDVAREWMRENAAVLDPSYT